MSRTALSIAPRIAGPRIAALLLALAAITGLLSQCSPASTSAPAENTNRIKIRLMTSLPIVWGDGASMESIVAGKASPAPIYSHWQKHYDIAAVDSLDGLDNSATDIVLLVQPPAMNPADLEALDAWVRAGGKAIILTDPLLVWPTTFPLGDKRRPLASGLLSPLLSHWGLEMQITDEGTGSAKLEFPGATVTAVGIGSFKTLPRQKNGQADCALSAGNVMARCALGDGHAIILADVDFLNDALWGDRVGSVGQTGSAAESVPGAARLIDLLIADLRN